MVKNYKNHQRAKRLFIDKYTQSKFIKENVRRIEAQLIWELHMIKQDIHDGKDTKQRCKTNICAYGLKAPQTIEDCDRMIEDLKLWYP